LWAWTWHIVLTSSGETRANPFLPLRILGQTSLPTTGNRYVLTSMTTWPDAHALALEMGGWLWAVNDAREMNAVIDAFLPIIVDYGWNFVSPPGFGFVGPEDIDIYIGLTDSDLYGAVEGTWQWTNGDPVTFVNWAGGEPNNSGGAPGEDFAEIWSLRSSRTWNDDNDRDSGLDGLPPGSPARLPGSGNVAIIELPPIPPPLRLQINPETGYARLLSIEPTVTNLHSYAVSVAEGGLSPGDWRASNLAARGVDAPSGSSSPGDRWEVVQASDGLLFEAFLLGKSAISPNGSVTLGKILEPFQASNPPAIRFEFASSNARNPSPFLIADAPIDFVTFETPPLFAADFNGDDRVDGADFVRWNAGFGRAVGAVRTQGDANGDGAVDGRDLLAWQRAWNSGVFAAASATAVPEPLLSAWLCGAACLLGMRRKNVVRRVG
jgi:hypothetical protein